MRQYDVFLVSLDPTVGHEMKKTRPCVVISPDEMNAHLATIIIAPVTSKPRPIPTRVPVRVQGREGFVVLDQIRTVDKARLGRRVGALRPPSSIAVKRVLKEMLVD